MSRCGRKNAQSIFSAVILSTCPADFFPSVSLEKKKSDRHALLRLQASGGTFAGIHSLPNHFSKIPVRARMYLFFPSGPSAPRPPPRLANVASCSAVALHHGCCWEKVPAAWNMSRGRECGWAVAGGELHRKCGVVFKKSHFSPFYNHQHGQDLHRQGASNIQHKVQNAPILTEPGKDWYSRLEFVPALHCDAPAPPRCTSQEPRPCTSLPPQAHRSNSQLLQN